MDAKTSLLDPWLSRCRFQDRDNTKAQSGNWLQGYGTTSSRRDDQLIFQNIRQTELERKVAFDILNDYKDSCSTCKGIINRIQKLITDIEDIKKMETYAICDHCIHAEGKCKRCEYILSKLTKDQRMLLVERHQRFKFWLNKTKRLLDTIMNGEKVCRGTLHRRTFDAAEFENLLQELKTPMTRRYIEESCQWADKFTRCKVMLREIIIILKLTEGKKHWLPEESVNELMTKTDSSSRLENVLDGHETAKQSKEGKNIKTKVIDERLDKQAKEKGKLKSNLTVNKSSELKKKSKLKVRFGTIQTKSEKSYDSQESTKKAKEKGKLRSYPAMKIGRGNEEVRKQPNLIKKMIPDQTESKSSSASGEQDLNEEEESKLSSNLTKSVSSDRLNKQEVNSNMRSYQTASDAEDSKTSSNIAESEYRQVNKRLDQRANANKTRSTFATSDGSSVSDEDDRQVQEDRKMRPKHDVKASDKENMWPKNANRVVDSDQLSKEVRNKSKLRLNHGINEGSMVNKRIGKRENVKRKQLKDHTRSTQTDPPLMIFSLLPKSTEKKNTDCIFTDDNVRHVKTGHFQNIDGVKMQLPDNRPIFYKLSDKKFIEMGWTQMPTSKIMRRMNIYNMEPTRSDWFDQVEDGTMLTYSTGETLATVKGGRGKWYYRNGTVALDYYYTEEELMPMKRYVIYSHEEDPAKPQSVLACFDHLGNGVVYDMKGRERLKYNQSEGLLTDPKLGTPCQWKWHFLNEPPVLQHGFIDTHPKNPSPELEAIIKKYRNLEKKSSTLLKDPLLSIELQNAVKEGMAARKDKFIALKIKMKTVKINDYFTLRLFEQANINVLFRDGDKSLKLNLGMILKSDDIIGCNVFEAFHVVTPFKRVPSAQHRLSNIDMNKMREKLELVEATNQDLGQFDLKRDFYNVVDSDSSNIFASSFKLINLR